MSKSSRTDYIDLIKLQALGSANGWNEFLTDCDRGCLVNKLNDVQQRLELGLAKLAREKMDTPEMVAFYCRLIKSIDNTYKKINKKMHKNILDDPTNKIKDAKALKEKRDRDHNLELWRKKNSY